MFFYYLYLQETIALV